MTPSMADRMLERWCCEDGDELDWDEQESLDEAAADARLEAMKDD